MFMISFSYNTVEIKKGGKVPTAYVVLKDHLKTTTKQCSTFFFNLRDFFIIIIVLTGVLIVQFYCNVYVC